MKLLLIFCVGIIHAGDIDRYHCKHTETSHLLHEPCCNSDETDCSCDTGRTFCKEGKKCVPKNQVCEKCDLNEIECYVTKESSTCITQDDFQRQDSYSGCQNGRCVHYDVPCGKPECKKMEFHCGGTCKPLTEFAFYRSCFGNCMRRNETCYIHEPTAQEYKQAYGMSVGIPVGVVFFLLVGIAGVIFLRKRKNIESIDDNPIYGQGEDQETIEIVDENPYYGRASVDSENKNAIVDNNEDYGVASSEDEEHD